MQSQSKTDFPLFPEDFVTKGYDAECNRSLQPSAHDTNDSTFTEAIKNLSNNLVIQ